PYAQNNAPHSSKGRQAIQDKLNKIIINDVFFDNLRLEDVIKTLDDEAKKRDPEKKGINFLLNANVDPPPAVAPTPVPVDNAGGGVPGAVPTPPVTLPSDQDTENIGDIQVKINPAMHDLRLADVLEIITRVAKVPGSNLRIKYTIEDYAVVFSLRRGE